MRSYRLYLRKDHKLVSRRDFQAEDATAARLIATSVSDACSYKCDWAELWEGTDRIDWQHPRATLAAVNAANQSQMLDKEIALANSAWAIAYSRQLMDRLAATKAESM